MLASGMCTLLEKQLRYLEPTRLTLWVRPGLAGYCRQYVVPYLKVPTKINEPLDDEPALLVSGRSLHFGKFEYPNQPAIVVDGHELISSALVHSPGLAHADAMRRTDRWMEIFDLPHMMPQSRMAQSLCDLVGWNEESLVDDAIRMNQDPKAARGKPGGAYHLVHEENVLLGEYAQLGPGCVLDASHGPVAVGRSAVIGANAVLTGPCHVGEGAQVMPQTLIRSGTSIGAMSKVGGEIGNSIMMPYSNKAHYGYMGDSLIGEWVNIGAGTTTSNLKNTYGPVRMRIGNRQIQTERNFVGSFIGDHTKTAIGTRLMTGTYIGYCCSISRSAPPPNFVGSFTFLTDKGAERYQVDKAQQVMTNMFARRSRKWSEADLEMIKYVEETAPGVEDLQE